MSQTRREFIHNAATAILATAAPVNPAQLAQLTRLASCTPQTSVFDMFDRLDQAVDILDSDTGIYRQARDKVGDMADANLGNPEALLKPLEIFGRSMFSGVDQVSRLGTHVAEQMRTNPGLVEIGNVQKKLLGLNVKAVEAVLPRLDNNRAAEALRTELTESKEALAKGMTGIVHGKLSSIARAIDSNPDIAPQWHAAQRAFCPNFEAMMDDWRHIAAMLKGRLDQVLELKERWLDGTVGLGNCEVPIQQMSRAEAVRKLRWALTDGRSAQHPLAEAHGISGFQSVFQGCKDLNAQWVDLVDQLTIEYFPDVPLDVLRAQEDAMRKQCDEARTNAQDTKHHAERNAQTVNHALADYGAVAEHDAASVANYKAAWPDYAPHIEHVAANTRSRNVEECGGDL